MNLFKIITIIIAVWLVLKVKRFISGIRITSGKSSVGRQKEINRKTGMDIQDADYEDVE